jgi:hypothetical protein
MMRTGFVVSQSCRWGKKIDKLGLTNGRKSHGTSATVRVYRLWTRVVCTAQSGHGTQAGVAVTDSMI